MNFDEFKLAATGGDLYNFTEPQMLCSGNISSIQYCYVANKTMEQQDIFRFLLIRQSHPVCTLDVDINVTSIPHPGRTAQCKKIAPPKPELLCCDRTQLQYSLSSSYNYSFGIGATNANIHLLHFKERFTFPQLQTSIPATEFSFQVNGDLTDYIKSNFTDSPLPLLRLQIGITWDSILCACSIII